MTVDLNSIMSLPYEINTRLRYGLNLPEWSTREDVRRVRAQVAHVRGIGPVKLAIIDAWLDEIADGNVDATVALTAANRKLHILAMLDDEPPECA